MPDTPTNDDLRWGTGNLGTGEDVFLALKESFDMPYEEGRTAPRRMSVGLHMRLVVHPGRASGLARFLDDAESEPDVRICRRLEIAGHWRAVHPCPEGGA